MNRRPLSTACFLFVTLCLWAQAPHGTGFYYLKAHGKKGAALKTAFYEIIKNPSVIDYDSLWVAYQTSDAIPTDTVPIIWDMYSNISAYSIYTNLHRNGLPEGTRGFQREHSMPKSWFNPRDKSGKNYTYKDIKPMYSDLTHVIPAEGSVNNRRSNNPYGTTEGESYKSANDFSKIGACTYPGYTGKVLEPNDIYKGDLARIYFYMVTCYEDSAGVWTSDMFNTESTDNYQPFSGWAFQMLMEWAKNDPVSQKEIDRNEVLWRFQGNRNPFVDYPELAEYIWGDKKEVPFDYGGDIPEGTTSDNVEVILNKTLFGVDWSHSENMRSYWDRTPLVFEKNGIIFTFGYGIEGSRQYADDGHIRLYNGNTLTVTAQNNELTELQFTATANHSSKKLEASTGTINNNTWSGNASQVVFSSSYVKSGYNSSTDTSIPYYVELSDVKVTVANPTGIQQVKKPVTKDDTLFNLLGVQVDEQSLAPGIYIKNGRKVVVK